MDQSLNIRRKNFDFSSNFDHFEEKMVIFRHILDNKYFFSNPFKNILFTQCITLKKLANNIKISNANFGLNTTNA